MFTIYDSWSFMQVQLTFFNAQQINNIIRIIHSHQFNEGIYLVKRKSVYTPVIEHYGFAVVGKYLKYFDSSWNEPRVIHKTNIGIHADSFNLLYWEKVEKISETNIPQAIIRTRISVGNAYNLLLDNCEHFARFVTTGKKESLQVQNVVGFGLIGWLAYLCLKDN